MENIKEQKTKEQKTKEQEMNEELYIKESRKNINEFLYNNNYKAAFLAFILVLERLDANQKNEFIDYYSKNLTKIFTSGSSHLEDRHFQSQIFEV
jgi:hypothetical protein